MSGNQPAVLSKFSDQENIMETQERKQKREYTHDPVLPPCQVCEAKASGYHFGVITCEACKVFFRRSLIRDVTYFCSSEGKCKIFPIRRIGCSYCRLKKCMELGMSRNGIHRGRYTTERRTECIQKVKEIAYKKKTEEQYKNGFKSDESLSEEDKLMYTLIEGVTKADSANLMINDDQMRKIREEQSEFLEHHKLSESVFGPMKNLRKDEYLTVYRNTGIDLGNRKEKFAKCIAFCLTDLTTFIGFAKSVPGFSELSTQDQITLLRESVFDWMFFSGFETYNVEHMLFTCSSCLNTWCLENIKDRRFVTRFFAVSAHMRKLKLHKDELAIIKALIIFSPDGSDGQIEDRALVEKYQQKLSESLLTILRKNRQLDDSKLAILFGRIVHALTEARDATIDLKELMSETMKYFPDLHYPDLFVEILGDEFKATLDTARAVCISQNSSMSISRLSSASDQTLSSGHSQNNVNLAHENDHTFYLENSTHLEPTNEPNCNDDLTNILSTNANLQTDFVCNSIETFTDSSVASSVHITGEAF